MTKSLPVSRPQGLIRWLCLLMAGLAPQILPADVVHLANGRSMEGVILEETPTQILLRLPFGEIGLPRTSIARIERGRSPLEEFLDRQAALERDLSGAAEWLELALWAERQGLDHSAREAVLVAARLDPGLPGLASPMATMGYEYEPNLAIWIPYEELMRRRGYVQSNGRWLSPDEALAVERAQQVAASTAAERQRRDRLARALEMMVVAQMVRAEEERRLREESAVVRDGIPLWGGYPVLIAPGYWPRPPLRPMPHRRGDGRGSRHGDAHRDAIVARPPGSLIPVTANKSHGGGFQSPSGQQ